MFNVPAEFINEQKIQDILDANQNPAKDRIQDVLSKAREMKGLNLEDVAILTCINEKEMLSELFQTANKVKETIYGKRLVLFAPL
jgi:2-iminoacetate synthase